MSKKFSSTPSDLWDAVSSEYEETTYEQKAGLYPANSFRSKILLDFFEKAPKGTVLDAGCGTGQMTRELLKRGWDVTSVDYSKGMIDVAKKKTEEVGLSGKFSHLSLFELETLDQKFDYIMLNGVLPYIAVEEEPKVFEQLHKVSSAETVLLCANYNLYFDFFALDNWTAEAVENLLKSVGLPEDAYTLAKQKVVSLLKNPETTLDLKRTMKTENPALYHQKLLENGFEETDQAFYNFFYLPAKFQDEQDSSVREKLELSLCRDPRGLLLARGFVSISKRVR